MRIRKIKLAHELPIFVLRPKEFFFYFFEDPSQYQVSILLINIFCLFYSNAPDNTCVINSSLAGKQTEFSPKLKEGNEGWEKQELVEPGSITPRKRLPLAPGASVSRVATRDIRQSSFVSRHVCRKQLHQVRR